MADFHGFTCDVCGRVWTLDKRTKVRMTFEHTEFCDLGSYNRDLCPNCTVEPFDWTPSRKKRHDPQPRHRDLEAIAGHIAAGTIHLPFEGEPGDPSAVPSAPLP